MSKVEVRIYNNRKINCYMTETINSNEEEVLKLRDWIKENILPYCTLKHPNYKHTSYKLKHMAEKELNFYVGNADLKKIMAELGIDGMPSDKKDSINYCYPISEAFWKNKLKNKELK